jgi:hypothetical protein
MCQERSLSRTECERNSRLGRTGTTAAPPSVADRYLYADENLASYVDTSEGIEAVVVAALRKDGDNRFVRWLILALPEHFTFASDFKGTRP